MKKIKTYILSVLMSLTMLFSFSVCSFAEDGGEIETGQASEQNEEEKPNVLLIVLVSVGGGVVIGFIYTGVLKAQLKSVHIASGAKNYISEGSPAISVSRDIFLYKKVERREKQPKPSSE